MADIPMADIVKGILVARTEKAILIEQNGEQTWIPKSVCDRISVEPGPPDMVEAAVEEWFVEKEGLEAEA